MSLKDDYKAFNRGGRSRSTSGSIPTGSREDARMAIADMKENATELLGRSDTPFCLVVMHEDRRGNPDGFEIALGFAGTLDEGKCLVDGIEEAKMELMKNLAAAKLGVSVDDINDLTDVIGRLKRRK